MKSATVRDCRLAFMARSTSLLLKRLGGNTTINDTGVATDPLLSLSQFTQERN